MNASRPPMQGLPGHVHESSSSEPRADRRVYFVFPGFSEKPVGGYKVAYEYANFLAGIDGVEVELIYAATFRLLGRSIPSRFKALAGAVRSWLQSRLRGGVVPWFPVHPGIRVRNSWRIPRIHLESSDVAVATAAQTAPSVAKWSRNSGMGSYFIQHWETWSSTVDFVEYTWRLPLRRIAIAPWLVSIANERQLDVTLIPNAIDPSAFPAGPPIKDRPLGVLALVSEESFKRTDLVVEVFRTLQRRNVAFSGATFGTCARPEGLPEAITHYRLPSKARLQELYQTSRVYFCASDAEGWHLPPAEAMMSGTAVASTDIGGVRAYAEGVALFSPPGDSVALSSNVERLLVDPSEAQSRATAGRMRLLTYLPTDAAEAFADAILGRQGQ